ncbi:MAG TPA: ABC transporter permease [Gemmatimonadales bacterium]|jgi:putative ABC transport system permease protein
MRIATSLASVSRFAASLFALAAALPLAGQGPPPARVAPIAIEQRLADVGHLRVGDTVHLTGAVAAPMLVRIAAIYSPQPDPATIMRRDYHVRLHLADLGTLLGEPDQVDRIGVVLQPGVPTDSAATVLNRVAYGYDVIPSHELATESSTTFVVVSRFHRAIAIISILASTIFLLCLMLLKVDERRRDVAVLRFTGLSRRTVFAALVAEATMIALCGSLLGTLIAAAASGVINRYYRGAYQTTLLFSELTGHTVVLAVAMSVALGVIAGVIASWRLVRTPAVDLWRRAA